MMQPALRCTLLAALGGGVTYLLKDAFTTNEAAPITSPRTCEPGPGTLTLVQVDGQFSISNGKLNFPAQVSPVWGDQGFYGSLFTRSNGRATVAKVNLSVNGYLVFGWGPQNAAPTSSYMIGFNGQYFYIVDGGNTLWLVATVSLATDYRLVGILCGTGFFALASGGVFGTWPACTLVWHGVAGSDNHATKFCNYSSQGTLDDLSIADLVAIPVPTVNVASPISGENQTATADAIHDLTVTAANPLAGTAELRYRVLDADNYWTAYCDSAGALKLDSVSGGIATNRISIAGVWTAGVTRTIRVMVSGTKHNCCTLAGTAWTQRGAQIDVSHQDTQTAINATYSGGPTVANLISYNHVQTIDNV